MYIIILCVCVCMCVCTVCIKGRVPPHCQETDLGMVRADFTGMGGGCSSLSAAGDWGAALLSSSQRGGRGGGGALRAIGSVGTALVTSIGR